MQYKCSAHTSRYPACNTHVNNLTLIPAISSKLNSVYYAVTNSDYLPNPNTEKLQRDHRKPKKARSLANTLPRCLRTTTTLYTLHLPMNPTPYPLISHVSHNLNLSPV